MSTHTKGPWMVCAYDTPLNEDGCIATDADQELEIRPAAGQKLGDKAAHFRLMARAPELIEALTCACNYIDVLGGDSSPQRAFIAEVTGGQP